jgi:6-pyruvoyl-tetrahydropterin synthase
LIGHRQLRLWLLLWLQAPRLVHQVPQPAAQRLHGATFVVEAEFRAETIDHLHLLIDIGLAKDFLRATLAPIDYRNLDAEPIFAGKNTTTEYLCLYIQQQLAAACRDGRLGDGGKAVTGIKVLLRESHIAWAAFEGPV